MIDFINKPINKDIIVDCINKYIWFFKYIVLIFNLIIFYYELIIFINIYYLNLILLY